MTGIDNLTWLTERFPQTWRKLKQFQTNPELLNQVQVVESKSKLPTLVYVRDGQEYFMHSKYDPLEEARKFTGQFQNGQTYRHIFFYGVGLGYHIELLLALYPKVAFTIFEPAPEILYHYLTTQGLSRLPLPALKHLACEVTPAETMHFLHKFANLLKEEVLFVVLPSYERVFQEHYTAFLKNFSSILFYQRTGLATNLVYQKKWAFNSIKNFKYILETPGFLKSAQPDFRGKPVVIAAAGPSLTDELDNLRIIKAKRLAYLFAAGSAIHPLLNHGIRPDAACLYDPNDNSIVYNRLIDQNIKDIPLIFGSSMGFSRFDEYPGPKFHFVVNQDRVAPYFLQQTDQTGPAMVEDSPTITTVIFQLLSKLGAGPIILVGQNLGFRGELVYATGISYYNPRLREAKLKDAFLTEAVDGSQIYTNNTYRLMRENLEHYIARHPGGEIYNATKGGARIAGAPFVALEELIKSKLTQSVVSIDWVKQTAPGYELSYLQRQQQRMKKEFLAIKGILNKLVQSLEQIQKLQQQNQTQKLETAFDQLDQDVKRLTSNHFFKSFIAPLLQVQLDLLARAIDLIQSERSPVAKAERIVREFGSFIKECQNSLPPVSEAYLRQVDGVIRERIVKNSKQSVSLTR